MLAMLIVLLFAVTTGFALAVVGDAVRKGYRTSVAIQRELARTEPPAPLRRSRVRTATVSRRTAQVRPLCAAA